MRSDTTITRWFGENASAKCLSRDECDWEGYGTVREITWKAGNHARRTGHPVQIDRAQFRVVNPVGKDG